MQCTNNLKQLGLGIHNFVSTNQEGLPPIILGGPDATATPTAGTSEGGRASIYVLLMPYMEQQASYDFLTAGATGSSTAAARQGMDRKFGYTWWSTLTQDQKNGLGSVAYTKCPSRRSGIQINDDTANPGPLSDYIALVYAANTSDGWHPYMNSTSAPEMAVHHGPFRPGQVTMHATDDVVLSWKVRDRIARWKDGTSNTLAFCERHIPISRVGQCGTWAGNPNEARHQNDCSFLGGAAGEAHDVYGFINMVGINGGSNTGSYNGRPIPNDPDYGSGVSSVGGSDTTTNVKVFENYAAGSVHPGVLNGLIGDGAVRAVSKTVNTGLLTRLSVVDDGVSVSLP